jgi:hypothetical protein
MGGHVTAELNEAWETILSKSLLNSERNSAAGARAVSSNYG